MSKYELTKAKLEFEKKKDTLSGWLIAGGLAFLLAIGSCGGG
ncbi:hypothetical protein J3E64_002602 [Sphingobium sp. OAS761]|nr:hypothetical protein [Sphingobium sp. OAS761]MCP1470909.1 hypothetical protein [Sphingobium sp. OAS761]